MTTTHDAVHERALEELVLGDERVTDGQAAAIAGCAECGRLRDRMEHARQVLDEAGDDLRVVLAAAHGEDRSMAAAAVDAFARERLGWQPGQPLPVPPQAVPVPPQAVPVPPQAVPVPPQAVPVPPREVPVPQDAAALHHANSAPRSVRRVALLAGVAAMAAAAGLVLSLLFFGHGTERERTTLSGTPGQRMWPSGRVQDLAVFEWTQKLPVGGSFVVRVYPADASGGLPVVSSRPLTEQQWAPERSDLALIPEHFVWQVEVRGGADGPVSSDLIEAWRRR